jgi:hypothetical protein
MAIINYGNRKNKKLLFLLSVVLEESKPVEK